MSTDDDPTTDARQTDRSDARTLPPTGLLMAAARLIERALIAIDTDEAPCPTCASRLFRNRVEARIYGQFSDLPERLKTAAGILRTSASEDPSRGYAAAKAAHTLVTKP